MTRLLTAAIALPLALSGIFLLPPVAFFFLIAFFISWASLEYVRIARFWASGAPLNVLPVLVVAGAAALTWPHALPQRSDLVILGGFLALLSIGVGCLVLFARTPVEQGLPAVGALAFGTLYFALPIAALVQLQRLDPWLVFLLVAVVWVGDSAAYYIGSRWGRRRLAPRVSPRKSWEGALAGLVGSLLATVAWSWLRLGRVDLSLVALMVVVAISAQLGDLVESVFKRGAGIKDSGTSLPGHGGWLDRGDGIFFAAPVFWLGLLLLGTERALA